MGDIPCDECSTVFDDERADPWAKGYLPPLPRSLFGPESKLLPDMVDRARFLDLLAFARFRTDRNGTVRGSCVASVRFLAERWGLSTSQVHRTLARWEDELLIRREDRRTPGNRRTPQRIDFTLYDAWMMPSGTRNGPKIRGKPRIAGTHNRLERPKTPDSAPSAGEAWNAGRERGRDTKLPDTARESGDRWNAGKGGPRDKEESEATHEGGATETEGREKKEPPRCRGCGNGLTRDRPDLIELGICETCARYEKAG